MSFKHSYMVVTTDFDLEPLVDQFRATYPDNKVESIQIAFKTENEHQEGDRSYIIVLTRKDSGSSRPSFWDFIGAYCKLHDKSAAASVTDNIFPQLEVKPSNRVHRHNKDS